MKEDRKENGKRTPYRKPFSLMTEEIYGKHSFFLLSLCLFYLLTTLWQGMMKPLYLGGLRLYLDGADMKRMAWAVFFLDQGIFWLNGYGKRSLASLFQLVLFPFLVCCAAHRFGEDPYIAGLLFLVLGTCCAVCGVCLTLQRITGRERRRGRHVRSSASGESGGATAQKAGRWRKRGIFGQTYGIYRGLVTVTVSVFCVLTAGMGLGVRDAAGGKGGWEADALWSRNRDRLELLREDVFAKMTPQEKLEAMQGIVELEMIAFGIDRVCLFALPMENENEAGYYDVDGGSIVISDRLLEEGISAADCLNTVLHECYHAYELACIRELNHGYPGRELRMHDKILGWQKDIQSYQTVGMTPSLEEYAAYYGQSVEEDARVYAGERAADYVEYIQGMDR